MKNFAAGMAQIIKENSNKDLLNSINKVSQSVESSKLTPEVMLWRIYDKVRKEGVVTNTAKTKWGTDSWELNGSTAFLEDEGYTHGVKTQTLFVRDSVGRELNFEQGSVADLKTLYYKLF